MPIRDVLGRGGPGAGLKGLDCFTTKIPLGTKAAYATSIANRPRQCSLPDAPLSSLQSLPSTYSTPPHSLSRRTPPSRTPFASPLSGIVTAFWKGSLHASTGSIIARLILPPTLKRILLPCSALSDPTNPFPRHNLDIGRRAVATDIASQTPPVTQRPADSSHPVLRLPFHRPHLKVAFEAAVTTSTHSVRPPTTR